ncbi:hypothetical protein Pst134EA_009073 [Puccinia striiformis f. sp. tritici]|uniref:hypothetical protein n=1 Tax=Puccinia striiformis f. sp. tritici TaxID=168172 RepID=UPI002007C2AF|nr:hypothetical protein Pst134EA_009073 [Puccinia striiformis f. sp. tritici]KAH9468535.1 hypothetical protein Pst134EA_009073 [Puccinia striiformis f. sp. tritici]
MSANPHSNHPLYAFLQSDTARHHVPSESPPPPTDERTESGMIGADRALNKHLATLLTTVQSHSAQLDQMVKHINSLVRRVESVESIFSEGQEQVHQSVTEFKADTEKIALQTADRINLTLQPTLNVFIDSLSSVNRQLEAVRSQVEQGSDTRDKQSLILAKLEKDVQCLATQINQVDSRLVGDKIEHSQKMDTLQKGFDTLNSSLAPIALMAPLLKAFLESQLRSSSRSQESFGKSSERHHDPGDHAEGLERTVNRPSSAISRGHLRKTNPAETRSLKQPESSASLSTSKIGGSNQEGGVQEELTVECCQSNQVRQTARADLKETATIFHGEQTGGSSKAEAEHEPTITQASQNHYKDEGAYGGGGETEEVMGESLDRILISHPSSKRRSMSRGRISTQQVLGLNVIQGGSCFTETTLGLHKTHSKKRGRSHTPVARGDHVVRSESISTTQLRRISFHERSTTTSLQIQNLRPDQTIDDSQSNPAPHKKTLKKNRRPLLLEDPA